MKFIKLLKYVECSYGNNPSFLMLMSDNKEYISNGCQFVENTKDNRNKLISEYDCKHHLNELFSSDEIDISEIRDARHMFGGCQQLTEFSGDISSVTDARHMFCGCRLLTEFSGDTSNVTNALCMFYLCVSLTEFSGNLSNIIHAQHMFDGCASLTKFGGTI